MKLLIIIISIMFASSLFTEAATTIRIYGKGGVVSRPDGTSIVCPLPVANICGMIMKDANAHASDTFTDVALHFDSEGNIDDKFNCQIVGWDEPTGQPIILKEENVVPVPKKLEIEIL